MERQDEGLVRDKHARNTFQEIKEVETVAEPTIEDLAKAIRKQPLNKPLYRKILIRLRDEGTTEEMEEFISSLSDFKYAVQPEGRFLEVLERAGGIERIGQIPTEISDLPLTPFEEISGSDALDNGSGSQEPLNEAFPSETLSNSPLNDDPSLDAESDAAEAEDSIRGVIWKTSGLGEEYLAETEPSNRLHTLFNKESDRIPEYELVMRACADEPLSLDRVVEILKKGKEERGITNNVHPSVYLDRLEAAGMITWMDGWKLTEEGRDCLKEIQ